MGDESGFLDPSCCPKNLTQSVIVDTHGTPTPPCVMQVNDEPVPAAQFRRLHVWIKAKPFAVDLLKISRHGSMGRGRCLRDQIIRAAFSVPSNIAEGNERESNQDALRFLLISKGSLGELRTQSEIIHEAGYLDRATWLELERRADEIAALLGGMIRYRRNRRQKKAS